MRPLERFKAAVNGFLGVATSPRYSDRFIQIPVSPADASKVPTHLNSIVMPIINWTAIQLGAMTIEVFQADDATDQDEIVSKNFKPVLDIIKSEANGCGMDGLLFGISLSLICEGTAFLNIMSDGKGRPAALQYLNHAYCSFNADDSVRYTGPDGSYQDIPRKNMVILKYNLDPEDSRRGFSPIKADFLEVLTDQERGQYTSSILRQYGVLGLVISPAPGESIDPNQAQAIAHNFRAMSTGNNRGRTMVAPSAIKVDTVNSSPNQMLLDKVALIPEQRICAAFGIPPAVLQLGAGMENSTYNNLEQMIKLAWNQFIIPFSDMIARQLTAQLLRRFVDDPEYYLGWDRRHVDALQENRKELEERYMALFERNILLLSQVCAALDFDPPKVDGYYSDLVASGQIAQAKAKFMYGIAKKKSQNQDV